MWLQTLKFEKSSLASTPPLTSASDLVRQRQKSRSISSSDRPVTHPRPQTRLKKKKKHP